MIDGDTIEIYGHFASLASTPPKAASQRKDPNSKSAARHYYRKAELLDHLLAFDVKFDLQSTPLIDGQLAKNNTLLAS